MYKYKTHSALAFAVAAAALAAVQPAAAQDFLLPSTPETGVWIETAHTNFKHFEASFPSTVTYLSARLPVSQRIRAVADLPFSHAKLNLFGDAEQTSSVFGNPYLGLEFAASQHLRLELGTRAPLNTADEESFADMLAFIADPLRPEAFLEDMIPLVAAATIRQALFNGFTLRARGGVTTLFNTGEESSDPEAALDYGLLGAYVAGPAQVALGVSGRWYATSDEGNLAETSIHHAALSADLQLGRVRPGVSLRVPLDKEYRQLVRSAVGVYLQVPLR